MTEQNIGAGLTWVSREGAFLQADALEPQKMTSTGLDYLTFSRQVPSREENLVT